MNEKVKNIFFSNHLLVWLSLLAVGAGLRLWGLSGQLLADDEWHAIHKLMQSDFLGIYQSFGLADHCIPLTLYYKTLTLTIGLTEWRMRLPILIAGILCIILLPLFLKKLILTMEEALVFSGFIAISPILVSFSRVARPYSLSVLLAFTALVAFYHWWQRPTFRRGCLYVITSALAAWFHILTLAITLVPFVYFGVISLWSSIKTNNFKPVLYLMVIGCITLLLLLLLLLLLGLPLYNDFHALTTKSGVNFVNLESLWGAISLFSGVANTWLILCWGALVFIGAGVIVKRKPLLAYYFFTAVVVSCFIIISTSGAWIHHSLVLARYLLPILPIFLMLAALGLVYLLKKCNLIVKYSLVGCVFSLFYFLGPIPAQYHQSINQFTGHMSYQFDYDAQRNIYNKQLQLVPEDVPAFYRDLAKEPANTLTLLVAPWYMEWHWNSLHLYQRVHRQKVLAGFITGLCVDETFGEYPVNQQGIDLVNVAHVGSLVGDQVQLVDYFVYHKKYARQPPLSERPNIDFKLCEKKIIKHLGAPMLNNEDVMVFQINKKL